MPLTGKGQKILANLGREYPGRGKEILYAGKNKGTFTGIDAAKLDAAAARLDALKKRMDASEGFERVKRSVAQNPDIHDPAAVAAAIGRKKLGQAEMTRRSIAGRK